MAELKVTASNFRLKSSWTCTVKYLFSSSGTFLSVTSRSQTYPNTATKTVTFSTGLPNSTKIISAKVYVEYSVSGWGSYNFKINGTNTASGGSVDIDSSSFSNGSVDVTFTMQANRDTSTNHDSAHGGHSPTLEVTKTFSHDSTATISNVYLLVEYQSGSVIYHAENGVLVPYQLFHAEDGKLVPYQIQHGEGGILIPY